MIDVLAAWWTANALVFLAGSLALTGLGTLVVAAARAPIARRRLAETTLLGLWFWLLLAMWPRSGAPGAATAAAVVLAAPGPLPLSALISPVVVEQLPAFDPRPALGGLLAGTALLSVLRLIGAWFRLRRLLASSTPAPAHVVALARALPLASRPVRLVVSLRASRPFCCGLLRPHLVLPARLLAAAASMELRSVLLHELAHLRQGDLRGHVLFALTSPLQSWNPCFWWLRREAALATELVADDLAARHLTKSAYVRALMDMAERLPPAPRAGSAALAVVGQESEFFRRMNMLLRRHHRLATRCSRAHALLRLTAAGLVAVAASLAWSATPLAAQEVPAATARPAPPPGPAAEVVGVSFPFADERDLAAKLARLATRGIAIHGLELTSDQTTATVKVVPGQRDQVTSALSGLQAMPASPPTPPTATTAPPAPAPPVVAGSAAATPTPERAPSAERSSRPAAGDRVAPTGPRTYFNFKDTEATKVIATIAKIAGKNILVPATLKGSVTIVAVNVPWRDALASVAAQVGHAVTEDAAGNLLIVERAEPAPQDRR